MVKMRRSILICPEFQCLQRVIRNRRKTFEFEWNIFPGDILVDILRAIHTRMTVPKTRPEEFEDRIIFMSTFNDIDWTM